MIRKPVQEDPARTDLKEEEQDCLPDQKLVQKDPDRTDWKEEQDGLTDQKLVQKDPVRTNWREEWDGLTRTIGSSQHGLERGRVGRIT